MYPQNARDHGQLIYTEDGFDPNQDPTESPLASVHSSLIGQKEAYVNQFGRFAVQGTANFNQN